MHYQIVWQFFYTYTLNSAWIFFFILFVINMYVFILYLKLNYQTLNTFLLFVFSSFLKEQGGCPGCSSSPIVPIVLSIRNRSHCGNRTLHNHSTDSWLAGNDIS